MGFAKKRVLQALEKVKAIGKHESKGAGRAPRADVKTRTADGPKKLYHVLPWMLSDDPDMAVPMAPDGKVPLTVVK
jgi:hypothetical protein